MALIEKDALLKRFTELLVGSTQVDIAVAWAGPGPAVDALLEQAESTRIRIAVGLSGDATEPATLRRLMGHDTVDLRVVPTPKGGIFHSKFYRFRQRERTVCWIGSANFTRPGFGGNDELVNEFSDRDDEGVDWFEALWQDLDEDPSAVIDHYEEHREPARPRTPNGIVPKRQDGLPNLLDISTWDDFVNALRDLDQYCHQKNSQWDVLGETYSYLHAIGTGREVALRGNWEDFGMSDRNVLCGLGDDGTGEWGLLGNMQGAGTARGAFTSPVNHKALNHVLEQIGIVVEDVGGDLAQAAQRAVAGIRQLSGFGPAVATRILTLARPDCLVSVNTESAAGLGQFAGMRPNADYLAKNYGDLLTALHDRQWFNVAEPSDGLERDIWRFRAALVDAFFYIPRAV